MPESKSELPATSAAEPRVMCCYYWLLSYFNEVSILHMWILVQRSALTFRTFLRVVNTWAVIGNDNFHILFKCLLSLINWFWLILAKACNVYQAWGKAQILKSLIHNCVIAFLNVFNNEWQYWKPSPFHPIPINFDPNPNHPHVVRPHLHSVWHFYLHRNVAVPFYCTEPVTVGLLRN